ncbi:hypothetical protein ACFLYX_03945 [Chloroflexota bacterium]
MNLVLEGLEVFTMLYESEESWGIISQLITQKIGFSYFGIQFIFGAMVPLLVLGGVELVNLGAQVKVALRFLASVFVLIGVFAMRWNVVIGGQLISKSLRGFNDYIPPLLGINGLFMAIVMMALPFIILAVSLYLIPPWQEETKLPERMKTSSLTGQPLR